MTAELKINESYIAKKLTFQLYFHEKQSLEKEKKRFAIRILVDDFIPTVPDTFTLLNEDQSLIVK